MIRTYKYRIGPNKSQRMALDRTLESCRDLYNLGLEQRKGQRIGKFSQMLQLKELKSEFPEYKLVYAQTLQNVLKQLDGSFNNFFRRCKLGGSPGYPRFKSRDRFKSFSYNKEGWSIEGKKINLSKIGNVKIRMSRDLPVGCDLKTCTVKREISGWYVYVVLETSVSALPSNNTSIGIDVGIEKFAALSDGTFIPNPRFYESGQNRLRTIQRVVARRKKGSNRRLRAVLLLRKYHERIGNRRSDFLHKKTTELVRRFGYIAVENLNVKGLAAGILAKQVRDASWAKFFNQLSYKAAEAGRRVIEVDTKYTSQTCPGCKAVKKKSLSERVHRCPCGYAEDRDTAAARVILARMGPSGDNVSVPMLSVV